MNDPTPKSTADATMLGPFLGYVTTDSIKIWLHQEGAESVVYVTVHPGALDAPMAASAILTLGEDKLFSDCATISALQPDTLYFYRLWTNPGFSFPLALQGLAEKELRFQTLSADPEAQVDFVVMSCHNPTVSKADGYEGHAVWADLPQIIAHESNQNVRFALLVGDQIYIDDWKDRILAETTHAGRVSLYLEAYRKFWSNIHYRRILCSLPSVMMWDDHDIVDGWGSDVASFVGETSEFKPNWQALFGAAFDAFGPMQASRNPPGLSNDPRQGWDFCFRVGKWGFVFMDLRSNRNWRLHRILSEDQAARIRSWVEDNRKELNTLFVISTVVFSHGSRPLEDTTVKWWGVVMKAVGWIGRLGGPATRFQRSFNQSLGDIRDDIRDSWACQENGVQADMVLDFLFGLQNDQEPGLGVVILSGDIHTPGYATIYSRDASHARRSSIPHITSTPVAYAPFNWMLEAVYRHASKTVAVGDRGAYTAQVSHHFCSRSVVVLSIRPSQTAGDYQLKAKYYLEGFPEPQILLFDLNRTSHREDISWVAQEKLFGDQYTPTANIDIEGIVRARAKQLPEELNWTESIVDLMKVLGFSDTSLGMRKKLAQQLGYEDALNGSAKMNMWLQQQLVALISKSGGKVPDGLEEKLAAAVAANA